MIQTLTTITTSLSYVVRHEYIDRSGASISSPNFPKDYNDNEESTYHVVAPTGSVVVLYFNHFDIEGNLYGEGCHDILEVSFLQMLRCFKGIFKTISEDYK